MKFPHNENMSNKGKKAKLGPNPLGIEWRPRVMIPQDNIVSERVRGKKFTPQRDTSRKCSRFCKWTGWGVNFPLKIHNHASVNKS